MKKTLPELQYARLLALYNKLNARLNRHFTLGRFAQFSKAQQHKLISRIERIKAQLLRMERGLKLAGSALAIGAALYSTDAHAQFAAQGSEFQVNNYTNGNQQNPAIAMDAAGGFVEVWQSYGQDGNSWGIYAQRYNASGVAQGSEFQVNSTSFGSQTNPSVAMDSDGDFVVVWENNVYNFITYNYDNEVYGQRYDAVGVAQGSSFQVNTYTTSYQQAPSVAMDADGDFVVVWQSKHQDGDDYGIYGQRYNASGVAQGSEFLVNTYTSSYQKRPSVAMDSDGDFVVVWDSYDDQDGSGYGIYGQRYNASGVAQGSEFLVNTYTSDYQMRPSVAMDAAGDFVVVWESEGQDGSSDGVYGQRYNATGVAQGTEFLVNVTTSSGQNNPSITMADNGNFVVAWRSQEISGPYSDIYAKRYVASGVAVGSEFLVNTHTTATQTFPSVAMADNGNFVVTWQDHSAHDGSSIGVFAQRYNGGFPTTTAVELSSDLNERLSLYPNPAQNDVFVNLEGEANIKVLDLSGQLIQQTQTSQQRFSVAGLQAGVYLIEITQGEAKAMKKLVVK